MYIAAKNNPHRAAFANQMEEFLAATRFKGMDAPTITLAKNKLDIQATNEKVYGEYIKRFPNTKIKLAYVEYQYANKGKELSMNGGWKNIGSNSKRKVYVPLDKNEYTRIKHSYQKGSYDLEDEFLDVKIDNPFNPGQKITAGKLAELRQEKSAYVKNMKYGEDRNALNLNEKTELSAAKNAVNVCSETLGLARSDHMLKKLLAKDYTDIKPLQAAYLGNGKTGQFDLLYQATDKKGNTVMFAVESKGGIGASYGHAQVGVNNTGVVESAQQGSIKYEDQTWKKMEKTHADYTRRDDYQNGTMSAQNRKIVEELGKTLDVYKNLETPTVYLGIELRIDSDTGTLGKTLVNSFKPAA